MKMCGQQGTVLGNRDYHGVNMMGGNCSEQIHAAAFELLRGRLTPQAKVLDVGAGHGAFSRRLHQAGYNVSAIEPFAEWNASEVVCNKANLNADWPIDIGESFDAIAAIEIIEHMENPFHFARQAHAKLRAFGLMVISTPNPLDILSRWRFFLTGTMPCFRNKDHRVVIFPETIDRICEECRFRIVDNAFDIDVLRFYASWRGFILKPVFRFVSRILMRDKRYLAGSSNIWLLEALPEA